MAKKTTKTRKTTDRSHLPSPPADAAPAADTASPTLDYRLIVHATNLGLSRLKSPLLDKVMHPDGAAPIIIMSYLHDTDKDDGNVVIDAFQIESVLDYLRHQADVRATLEREIPAYFATAEPSAKIPKGTAMWRKVEIYGVNFNRKSVITRERFEKMQRMFPKLKDSAFAGMAARQDQPETRSNFKIFVRGPWENEHEHFAQFRDGRFVEFTHQ